MWLMYMYQVQVHILYKYIYKMVNVYCITRIRHTPQNV